MNAEQRRHAAQRDFLESGADIVVGSLQGLPEASELAATNADSPWVEQAFSSGLTACVYKIKLNNNLYTLKIKRPESKVKNYDGETSFLNEVQRRCDFDLLKENPEIRSKFKHIADTVYASFHSGIILSPWYEGKHLQRYDERVFVQIFETTAVCELAGLMEWDLCPGNIIDDGQRIMLFDFGYMYKFNPLTEYNSNGIESPLFNGVERFETRNFYDFLVVNPQTLTLAAKLRLLETEKLCAVSIYEKKRDELRRCGAQEHVLAWHDSFITRWKEGIKSTDSLEKLYIIESFRSNVLDLHDDISGKSCTRGTLAKASAILSALEHHFDLLCAENGLFFGDELLNQSQLLNKYQNLEEQAHAFQIV